MPPLSLLNSPNLVSLTLIDSIGFEYATIPAGFGSSVAVAYGAGLFVVLDRTVATRSFTSPDGINWTQRVLPVSRVWNGLTFNGTTFCAVGANLPSNSITSVDGINWNTSAALTARSWSKAAYGNGVWCVVDSGNSGTSRSMASADGLTWSLGTMPSNGGLNTDWAGVAFGNGVFVAMRRGTNRVALSIDGLNWSEFMVLPDTLSWGSITFAGGKFYISVGGFGGIASNDTVICATASDVVLTSPDGLTWQSHATGLIPDTEAVSSANDSFWSMREAPETIQALASNGSIFVATGFTNQSLMYSGIFTG